MSLQALKVAVLQGGTSSEASVSRMSAAEVAAGLAQAGHTPELLELSDALTRQLAEFSPDVVFPALHGPPGEDGTMQGYLDTLGLPYVGAGVRGSAVAMDKIVAKALFRQAGLPVAEEVRVAAGTDASEAADQVHTTLGERVVVKPAAQGSALGVVPLPNGGDLASVLKDALAAGGSVLVEPFVFGREMTVGVLDLHGENARAVPAIEVRTPTDAWYDFDHRYTQGASEHVLPAPVSERCAQALARISLAAHDVLELRDLSRTDFIVDDEERITLLEVNTLPGMTPTSLFPEGAAAIGFDFTALMDALVRSAARRGPR